jgi:hypothetical protein
MFAARALSCLGLEACPSMPCNFTCIPLVIVRGLHNRPGFLMASNCVAATTHRRWGPYITSYLKARCSSYKGVPEKNQNNGVIHLFEWGKGQAPTADNIQKLQIRMLVRPSGKHYKLMLLDMHTR